MIIVVDDAINTRRLDFFAGFKLSLTEGVHNKSFATRLKAQVK